MPDAARRPEASSVLGSLITGSLGRVPWPYSPSNSPFCYFFFLRRIYLYLTALPGTCVPCSLSVFCSRTSAPPGWDVVLLTAVSQHLTLLPGTGYVPREHLLERCTRERGHCHHHVHGHDSQQRGGVPTASVLGSRKRRLSQDPPCGFPLSPAGWEWFSQHAPPSCSRRCQKTGRGGPRLHAATPETLRTRFSRKQGAGQTTRPTSHGELGLAPRARSRLVTIFLECQRPGRTAGWLAMSELLKDAQKVWQRPPGSRDVSRGPTPIGNRRVSESWERKRDLSPVKTSAQGELSSFELKLSILQMSQLRLLAGERFAQSLPGHPGQSQP